MISQDWVDGIEMKQGKTYKPNDADRGFVDRAVKAGTSINIIADCLNISDDTLRKYYRYEIVTAREVLKGEAVRVLTESLTDNSLDAAKYVLSRIAGWTEKQSLEHTGKDGGPIKVEKITADADDFASAISRLATASADGKVAGETDD